MNNYICKYTAIVMMVALCCVMNSCGDDNDNPVPVPNPSSTVENISKSSIVLNSEENTMTVAVQEQVGGKAVLSGSVVETKTSSTIMIIGKYDTKKVCYVFDLSDMEAEKTYQYQVVIYNASGQKVMESDVLTERIPSPKKEKTEIDEYGTDGGSEGMRGGVIVLM